MVKAEAGLEARGFFLSFFLFFLTFFFVLLVAVGRGWKPNGADLRRQWERDVLRLEDGEITSQPLEVNRRREGGVIANEKSNPCLLDFRVSALCVIRPVF